MELDVFFSISQTPVDGYTPTEREMFLNFLRQVEAADRLGFGTAWVAMSHHSSEVQHRHASPVIPHWRGEVGLNPDIFHLATHVFRRTGRIEVGSAVMNILTNGGPIAAAEKVAAFAWWHGLDAHERRRIHLGFSGGRFEYMNRPFGVIPRDPVEEAAWPVVKGIVFAEAAEIFLRLLRGDVLSSHDIAPHALTRDRFRSQEDWARVQRVAGTVAEAIPVAPRYSFDPLQIVPRDWRRELVQPVVGSHDPAVQEACNRILPVQVFNLSITSPAVIEDTHRRLAQSYHPDGGPWKRSYMPRTTFVFLNATPGLTPAEQSRRAHEEANAALGEYWKALEGTLDPAKVRNAAQNALIGNPDEVARQAQERFHPDDRLMLWFDFFNHDCDRVIANMSAFMEEVAPRLAERIDR